MVSTSWQSRSRLTDEMMTRTRLDLPGLTRQWHSAEAGYSPGKLGDSCFAQRRKIYEMFKQLFLALNVNNTQSGREPLK